MFRFVFRLKLRSGHTFVLSKIIFQIIRSHKMSEATSKNRASNRNFSRWSTYIFCDNLFCNSQIFALILCRRNGISFIVKNLFLLCFFRVAKLDFFTKRSRLDIEMYLPCSSFTEQHKSIEELSHIYTNSRIDVKNPATSDGLNSPYAAKLLLVCMIEATKYSSLGLV